MLTAKDKAEIISMTKEQLEATERVMTRQIKAPFFIGNRDRSFEIRKAVRDETLNRCCPLDDNGSAYDVVL